MRCKLRKIILLITFCVSSNYCAAWEARIPETQNTALAEKILSENNDNILNPSMLNSLKELDKPIGWEFELIDSRNTKFGWLFQLKKKVNGEYHFVYFNAASRNHPKARIDKYKWVNGFYYYARNNTNKNNSLEYAISGEEQCKFTLGLCEYKTASGLPAKSFTEFRNGVWIHRKDHVYTEFIEKYIYDAYGFPLYRYYESLRTGGSAEERRVEQYSGD